jgi:phosphatidylserine decarboxylase
LRAFRRSPVGIACRRVIALTVLGATRHPGAMRCAMAPRDANAYNRQLRVVGLDTERAMSLRLLRQRGAIHALRLIPRNALSRLAGRAATVRLPRPLQSWVIRLFARLVGVDVAEIADPIESYSTVQEFFTRALPAGARPIDAAADAVVAPCDGFWGAAGEIAGGVVLQVKGRPYTIAALLGDAERAAAFDGGLYATFYLSPRDYHRFHMPVAARVLRAAYIPGSLWPVNRFGIEHVEGLFAQNERLCTYVAIGASSGIDACLVAVGATLVGRVRVTFDASLITNLRGGRPTERVYADPAPEFAKGAEWGRFEFGSTIVMLVRPRVMALDPQPPGTRLRLGERIGRLL